MSWKCASGKISAFRKYFHEPQRNPNAIYMGVFTFYCIAFALIFSLLVSCLFKRNKKYFSSYLLNQAEQQRDSRATIFHWNHCQAHQFSSFTYHQFHSIWSHIYWGMHCALTFGMQIIAAIDSNANDSIEFKKNFDLICFLIDNQLLLAKWSKKRILF